MADDESLNDEVYVEVLKPQSVVLNKDGTKFLLTLSTKDGPDLLLGIPSQYLLPLAGLSFVAANQACAIAGKLADQQILQSEAVEVQSGSDQVDIRFRLTDLNADLPISITRETARALLGQLAASLAQGSAPPSGRLQ